MRHPCAPYLFFTSWFREFLKGRSRLPIARPYYLRDQFQGLKNYHKTLLERALPEYHVHRCRYSAIIAPLEPGGTGTNGGSRLVRDNRDCQQRLHTLSQMVGRVEAVPYRKSLQRRELPRLSLRLLADFHGKYTGYSKEPENGRGQLVYKRGALYCRSYQLVYKQLFGDSRPVFRQGL